MPKLFSLPAATTGGQRAAIHGDKKGVHAKHVRNGVETLCVPTFEQNQEILQSTLTTFACT
jgi:hypothetical protein